MNKHPLDRNDDDDDDFQFDSSLQANRDAPQRQLMRWSTMAIACFGVLVVISSAAVNNFAYGSTGYWFAYIASRIVTFLLLLGFIGLLAAYQFSNLRKLYARMTDRSRLPDSDSAANVNSPESFSSTNPSAGARSSMKPLLVLVMFNLGILALAWTFAFLMSASTTGFAGPSMVLSGIASLVPALLITMIVFNRGFVRAYAIGALSTYILNGAGFLGMFMSMSSGASNLGRFRPGDFWYLGLQWTFVVLSGLSAAVYVWLLEAARRGRRQDTAE
jgi:hypothetical protein